MAGRKKVTDIYPIRRQEEEPVSPSFEVEEREALKPKASKSPALHIIGGLFVVSVIGVAALHFFFSTVSIVVQPETRTISVTQEVLGTLGTANGDTIPVRIVKAEKESAKLFLATGSNGKETKAKGIIRVYNQYSTSSQSLVAATRFMSEDGKIFRLAERVTVPGMQTGDGKLVAGFKDVEVVAAESGEDYNIDPSNFSLPGLVGTELYTSIFGKSSQGMIGGSQRQVAVVTDKDIETAHDTLTEHLSGEVSAMLVADIPEGFVLLPDSLSTSILSAGSLAQEGSELKQFNYTAKVEATAIAYLQRDAEKIARQFIEEEMLETERINEKTFSITYVALSTNENAGTIPLEAHVSSSVYQTVDTNGLKAAVQGISEINALDILSSYPRLSTAEISFWPFWIKTVPNNIERIDVIFSID